MPLCVFLVLAVVGCVGDVPEISKSVIVAFGGGSDETQIETVGTTVTVLPAARTRL